MTAGGFGDSVFDDPTTVRMLEQLGTSKMPVGNLVLGPMASRAEVLGMLEMGSWGGGRMAATDPDVDIGDPARTRYFGITPQLRRRLSVLDLLPQAPMDTGQFEYSVESGSFDTAVETSEGAVKAPGDLQLIDATCKAVTIAHWLRLKRQQISDVASLATTTQQRLIYGVMRRVEAQVLAGDGTGENILGILNTSGIASIPYAASTPLTDLALDGIVDVLVSSAEPNGVVLNPVDWAGMLKAKASGSGERLDSDGAFATPPVQLWGLPAVPNVAIAQGKALVGDFARGATLFVREGVNLRVSDSDQDAFIRNLVVMLAEGRFGLAIWQPSCFCEVHFA